MESMTFTPGQVYDLTGVSPEKLRMWRQRGIVERDNSGKWTRFPYSEVVAIACVAEMVAGGISVGDAASIMLRNSMREDILRNRAFDESMPGNPDLLVVIGHKKADDEGIDLDYFVERPAGIERILNEGANWAFFSVLNVSRVWRKIDAKLAELK